MNKSEDKGKEEQNEENSTEEEFVDEDFEQFVHQQRFLENNLGERVAPILESNETFQENLEDSLSNLNISKGNQNDTKEIYSPLLKYDLTSLYSNKNYDINSYDIGGYSNIEETKRFEMKRNSIDDFTNSNKIIDLPKMQQQISPMLNQQQDRGEKRYIEMQKIDALEDRNLPFERITRKKKRF